MGFFQLISEFFESIFNSSSPEVKKRQELRKLETELKQYQPEIYKSDMLQPNFAEMMRVLYESTRTIGEILHDTICGEDLQRNGKFEMQLLLTGFTGDAKSRLESLSYEARKQEAMDSDQPMSRIFDEQRRTLESLAKDLNTPVFLKIDEVIARLKQLNDVCTFNYITIIHKFDADFSDMATDYAGNFHASPLDTLASSLQDLYYLVADLDLNAAVGRALIALEALRKGNDATEERQQQIMTAVGKINSVFTKLLPPATLKKLIRLGKREPAFEPQFTTYKANARQKFADYLQGQFAADETRIQTEIKDFTISTELKELFGARELAPLEGYNAEMNLSLQENTPFSFAWITPLQTVKTFLAVYISDSIKALLNDIVIEGFFTNSSYKTEFSTIVYSVAELGEEISKFEKTFDRNGENITAEIQGLIADAHRDQDFVKKLGALVDKINDNAYQLIQRETYTILTLHNHLSELLVDAKKSKPDIINNIKVLLGSSRNRDNTGTLDQQFGQWHIFFEIMKNYIVVREPEKKHE